ncbi:esterase/lipase family protein [Methylobacterium haplocladii]|nr:alpha/beta hydrolase [Methylobacterium haplocladii]GJD84953.1 hypothetical protein HPGCJGGD_2836 [Methylobacterium haplocladii]GLS58341.1 hypothetical protein GCM10007887_10000 [Methylobacterium haplocladii]
MRSPKPSSKQIAGPQGRKVLVVVLHGLFAFPSAMEDIRRAAIEAYGPETVVHVPEMPYAHRTSGARATRIVSDLLSDIDRWVADAKPDKIVLLGHSVGATLARRTFLVASGCPANFRPEPGLACEKARDWARKVERVVLLSAFNRGWKISPRLSWSYSILFNVVGLVGHLVPGAVHWTPTAFDFRLGAPFMAQTRLHWLAYRRAQQGPDTAADTLDFPILIQLLGTQDDLVSPFDQVDIAVDGTGQAATVGQEDRTETAAEKQDYFLIEQPFTDHKAAVRLEGDAAAVQRRKRFIAALTSNRADLKEIALDPSLLADEIDLVEPKVENTVFVIHGIRDDGYWTHRIAERVRQLSGEAPGTDTTVFRSWTPTYGYFAMLPFMLPWIRREKVEWFMDQYVTAFAQYPRSDFHYVGHSNGTYLGARALRDYPAMHLKHVLFAGSVVRRDFDWMPLIDGGRVVRFQNVCSADDRVVAWLPKSIEWIRWFDLGGAGFDGFRDAGKRPEITEFRYVRGGHSAGIAEAHWERIAEFIVHGTPWREPPVGAPELYETHQDPGVAAFARTRLGIPLVVLFGGFVALIGYALGGWFGLLVAALIIRFVVTRL